MSQETDLQKHKIKKVLRNQLLTLCSMFFIANLAFFLVIATNDRDIMGLTLMTLGIPMTYMIYEEVFYTTFKAGMNYEPIPHSTLD